MNKKEYVSAIASVLRESKARKPISIPKQVFHISDDEGNSKDFTVQKTDKTVLYTKDDIELFLDAAMYVVEEALKRGEEVSIYGFGRFELYYRTPRIQHHVTSGEDVFVDGHYLPRFVFGSELRRSARLYELSLEDRFSGIVYPGFESDDDDDEEEMPDGS